MQYIKLESKYLLLLKWLSGFLHDPIKGNLKNDEICSLAINILKDFFLNLCIIFYIAAFIAL